MTTDGFFSAVQKESSDPNIITVRSRSRGDLVNLLAVTGLDKRIINTRGKSDYPFRVLLTRDEWIAYLSEATARLDYDNFKHVISKENKARSHTYGYVWGELLSIEKEPSNTDVWLS
jgi:hypothetical protein